MTKLTKTISTSWNGNGFGTDTAEWVVVGHENIAVRKLGLGWFAIDTNEYAIIRGRKVNKKIANCDTKAGLLEILATKLAA